MVQLSLPHYQKYETIVNVASVPQRSPFRYPGGKTWLVPRVRKWLISRPAKPYELIEPFAGGAIVGLTGAFENLAQVVTLVELDDGVAALWETILAGDIEWLTHKISTFDVTPESVQVELARTNLVIKEKAFQTLLRNRVNHGGIMAPGSGVIKHGEDGKGIKSRWYPATLKKRILRIAAIKDRIRFIEGDGLEVLKDNAQRPDAVFFIDPPYTAAGKKAGTRLYRYYKLDHEELFRIAETLAGDFLMTYDNTEEVMLLAQRHGFDTQAISMRNTHHAKMTELLISRNLDWARGSA